MEYSERKIFKLNFDRDDIHYWADRYQSNDLEHEIESVIAPAIRSQGYCEKEELEKLCFWKTPRSKPLVASNPQDFVVEVTRTAFTTSSERLRIEILTLLCGVGWPSASVLLHFGHAEPYPILDFRALWSLGIDEPDMAYHFDFWWQYTLYCRHLATEAGVDMRTLDRALWQYSKENQPTPGKEQIES